MHGFVNTFGWPPEQCNGGLAVAAAAETSDMSAMPFAPAVKSPYQAILAL